MNRIITISREFGSGGRELGKRLGMSASCPSSRRLMQDTSRSTFTQ